MAEPVSDNIEMLVRVVRRLAPLLDRFVFLGGAVTELLITEPGAPGARQTKDVDLVVDVVNHGEYSESLREQLVELGLSEDTRPGAPICRWVLDDMIIDIMPTRGGILGFSCEWYKVAYDSALPCPLPDGHRSGWSRRPASWPRSSQLSATVAAATRRRVMIWKT